MASFASALLISSLIVIYKLLKKELRFNKRIIPAGVILGLSNFGAVFYLISVLGLKNWESSVIFPTVSVLVVIMSSISAFLVFKEKISKKLLVSLFIGLVSIILINL